MGTKYAMETAIQAFFPGGTVREWFDYDGEPHHFQITIPLPGGITPEILEDLKRRVWHVKCLSSWLDTIIMETRMEKTVYITPVLGDGTAVTRPPLLEPGFPVALIAVRVSAALQKSWKPRCRRCMSRYSQN